MSQINFALECFGAAVTLLLIICDFREIARKSHRSKTMLAMLAVNFLVLVFDAVTSHLSGMEQYTTILYICNFFVYALGYLLTALFTVYLIGYISERDKISPLIPKVISLLCAVAIVLVAVFLHNRMYFSFVDGYYQRGSLYWISQVYPICILVVDMIIIVRHSKALGRRDTASLLSYGIIPIISMVIQIMVYGITLLYIATTLSLLLVYINVHVEQSRRLQQREKELSDARISVMLSQIRPHFLYNSLTAIKTLCVENPQEAEKAIDKFAKYLRANMDSLAQKDCVPFSKELDHVQNYLSLEKMRFGANLNVVYNIRATNFCLPVLSLQPLVENAVKYGLGGRENGGTITISTYENDTCFFVAVGDDGVGFDVNSDFDSNRTHIGIENVVNRLSAMCNATVKIESTLDVGTTVIAEIPREGNER